jgi:hypothetical protein
MIPIWLSLSHDHICQFTAINCAKGSIPTIEAPFYKEGNILNFNKRNPNADKLQQVCHAHHSCASHAHISVYQVRDVAAGLTYLHSKNIPHGNICPVRPSPRRLLNFPRLVAD